MIAEIGEYALILAFLVALAQGTLPLLGAGRGIAPLMHLASRAALVQLALVALAFGALTALFITSDFTVAVVVANSHHLKPLLYKFAGVWGNHEGSLLLWVLILAVFGASVALFGGGLPLTLRARVLSVQGLIGVGFMAFMLFTSNPFARVFPPPLDGNDLNPLLQDPGLAFHPPTLYLGYVGFSMAYAFAVAALIEGRVDPAWARWVRPWTLAAWLCLTAGITGGSWWAYYELGWGGWWYWDPVENASFMPWLIGTALLHSAIVVEKRDALKVWTILLAILTFGLSLVGTFLVRSGVLTSVHAFASDPARGVFVLGILVVAVGGALILFAWRAPSLEGGGLFQPVSREGGLVLNNLLLASAAASVFIGTLYPLFLDLAGGGTVSVGPPYFNATFGPLMVPLILAMGIGPLLAWKRADLGGILSRLLFMAGVSAAAALVTLWLEWDGPPLAVLGMALSLWLVAGTAVSFVERLRPSLGDLPGTITRARRLPASFYGMTLAHLGFAVVVIGVTGSTAWKSENIRVMHVGETTALAGYDFRLDGVTPAEGPNYHVTRAQFTVTRSGRFIVTLAPEKRLYVVGNRPTTEAAIHTNGISDIYAVIGDEDPAGGWTVRLYHQPFVPWIWWGAGLMALGGLAALADRRLRVALGTRARTALAPGGATGKVKGAAE